MADLQIYRGDTTVLTITVQKADGSGPETITGYSLWFTAKQSVKDGDADAVIRKDNLGGGQGGITILTQSGATLGQATVTIGAANTSGLPPVDLVTVYEVQTLDTSGNPETVARGLLHILADVQRAIA